MVVEMKMVRIHSAWTSLEIYNLKNVLEASQIVCEIRGEYRRAGFGDIPPSECWVELWVREQDEAAALEAMKALDDEPPLPWNCPKCREEIAATFGACWNCETLRPER